MDIQNALHKFKTAQQAHAQALEAFAKLTPSDDYRTIAQARMNERYAWRHMDAARHAFMDACLERIGR